MRSRSRCSSISANGRFVAFASDATNLVVGDTNVRSDVFVRDLQSGTTQRASVGNSGTQGNHMSGGASIIADGRYVVFTSFASNMVAGDTHGFNDVFVHERQTEATQPSDCIAPTTTAQPMTTNDPYEPGTWTNQDVVVFLDAQDNEGGSRDGEHAERPACCVPERSHPRTTVGRGE
jgi:Tol biopolymer transport system component